MPRTCILLVDSLGVGASLDAAFYGDEGANTLGHIAEYCVAVRKSPLHIPHLCRLGLQNIVLASSGQPLAECPVIENPQSLWGYAVKSTEHTLLDYLKTAGNEVIVIDTMQNRISSFDATLKALQDNAQDSLIFTNFVDCDSQYGHRRDPAGYALALEALDQRLPELEALLKEDDCVVITADHGCDPTFSGSDHTREHIPIIFFGPKITPGWIGRRETLADIGQSIAQFMRIAPLKEGVSFF